MKLRTNQQGLIPLLLAIIGAVLFVIIFAFMKVKNAQ